MNHNEQEWKEKWDFIYRNKLMGYLPSSLNYAIPQKPTELLQKYLLPFRKFNQSDKVLEIGCGVGSWLLQIYNLVGEIYGTDISESAICSAKHLFRKENNVFLYAETDLLKLFKEPKFNFIYSITVFQHLPKWQTVNYFNQAEKILLSQGMFFFNVLAPYKHFSPDANPNDLEINKRVPAVYFTMEELKNCFKNWNKINIEFMKVEHPDPNYGWYIVRAYK